MLKLFASDRSHMISSFYKLNKPIYSSPVPNYEAIINENKETNNLNEFLDVSNKNFAFGLPFCSET
jgi:hypothetical protein